MTAIGTTAGTQLGANGTSFGEPTGLSRMPNVFLPALPWYVFGVHQCLPAAANGAEARLRRLLDVDEVPDAAPPAEPGEGRLAPSGLL